MIIFRPLKSLQLEKYGVKGKDVSLFVFDYYSKEDQDFETLILQEYSKSMLEGIIYFSYFFKY